MIDESKRKRPYKPLSEEHKRKIGRSIYRGIQDYKKCPHCGETKPKEEFGLRGGGRFLKSYCKNCAAKKSREKHKKDPSNVRKQNRKFRYKVYGINEDIYNEMVINQNGKCAICGKKGDRDLFIDHDHEGMYLRDLLCTNCNTFIGFCNESIEVLKSAISYIEKWKNKKDVRIIPEKYRHRILGESYKCRQKSKETPDKLTGKGI